MKEYLRRNVEFADPRFYDVTASWIMASYRLEDWNTVPYLVIVGPKSSGKTRLLDCLNRLAFRCAEFVTPSHAALFRYIELYNPTICLDESQFLNNKTKADLIAVLNAGYKRDISVIRVGDDPARTIQNFRPFSFKAIAGTEELADTLESRGVPVKMSRNIAPVDIILDEDDALSLRNRLIWYRFTELKTDGAHEPRYKYDNERLSNLGITNGRLLEIFQPLLEVAPTLEIEAVTIDIMREAETTRLDSDQCTTSGLVFAAVLACENSLDKGLLPVQAVTDTYNAGLREKEQVSSKTIGRRLHGLGFEKKRVNRGTCIVWNTDLVNRLKRQFGEVRPPPPLKETTQTTQTALIPTQPDPNHVVSVVSAVSVVSLEGLAKDVVEIVPVTTYEGDNCALCGKQGKYQISYKNGEWGFVCASCGQKIAEKLGLVNHARHVLATEPCPICGQFAVEYEIKRNGVDEPQRLCFPCLNEIRKSNAFLEMDMEAKT